MTHQQPSSDSSRVRTLSSDAWEDLVDYDGELYDPFFKSDSDFPCGSNEIACSFNPHLSDYTCNTNAFDDELRGHNWSFGTTSTGYCPSVGSADEEFFEQVRTAEEAGASKVSDRARPFAIASLESPTRNPARVVPKAAERRTSADGHTPVTSMNINSLSSRLNDHSNLSDLPAERRSHTTPTLGNESALDQEANRTDDSHFNNPLTGLDYADFDDNNGTKLSTDGGRKNVGGSSFVAEVDQDMAPQPQGVGILHRASSHLLEEENLSSSFIATENEQLAKMDISTDASDSNNQKTNVEGRYSASGDMTIQEKGKSEITVRKTTHGEDTQHEDAQVRHQYGVQRAASEVLQTAWTHFGAALLLKLICYGSCEGEPVDGFEDSSSKQARGSHWSSAQASDRPPRKRAREGERQSGDNGNDEGDEDPYSPGGKECRTSHTRLTRRLKCPFYQREPEKYARAACRGEGFSDMAKLKDHIKRVHTQPNRCSRCWEEMESDDVYAAHLQAALICDIRPEPADDRIRHPMLKRLDFKKAPYAQAKTAEQKWKLLYSCLFPEDTDIPSAFDQPRTNLSPELERALYEVLWEELEAELSGVLEPVLQRIKERLPSIIRNCKSRLRRASITSDSGIEHSPSSSTVSTNNNSHSEQESSVLALHAGNDLDAQGSVQYQVNDLKWETHPLENREITLQEEARNVQSHSLIVQPGQPFSPGAGLGSLHNHSHAPLQATLLGSSLALSMPLENISSQHTELCLEGFTDFPPLDTVDDNYSYFEDISNLFTLPDGCYHDCAKSSSN